MPRRRRRRKSIKHYKSSQKILLVGEANFSFALSLATAFGNASNIFATSLDSYEEVISRYGSDAESNIQVLKEKGCIVIHKVNAHSMSQHRMLRDHEFDVIVFNFPHAKLVYNEHHPCQIELHRGLIRVFFKNAFRLMSATGETHVTHKTAYPFDQWNITELAIEAGMVLSKQALFDKWEYPGYSNKRGEGHSSKCNRSFPIGECSTFMFRIG